MPKLTPFDVTISRDKEVLKSIPIVPLVEHSGGKGPNWTIHRDHSPGGRNSVKFKGKKDVQTYFERKYPENKGYNVELN